MAVFVIEDIQGTLGYVFHHKPLLYEALTHRSFLQAESHPSTPHNERLEFLGDAVLGLVVSESLVGMFPHSTEGELSKLKAGLISRATLAKAAARVNLGQWLRLGRGEEVSLGRAKHSLLANALEALIGAVYLDSGVESARTLIHRLLAPEFLALRDSPELPVGGDWKSRLQEWMHKHEGACPHYRLIQESGPDHQKVFFVNVESRGKVIGQGQGRTKKEAEQRAAEQALDEVCRQGSGTTRN